MINLKNNKGAITLYILVSLLFFIIAIVNVQTHLKTKEASVESEYQKIKASYEKDMGEVYSEVVENSIITFTIDGVEYQAIEGMTWAAWVSNTEYNTAGYMVGSTASRANYIYTADEMFVVTSDNSSLTEYYCSIDKTISDGDNYYHRLY